MEENRKSTKKHRRKWSEREKKIKNEATEKNNKNKGKRGEEREKNIEILCVIYVIN
jgi:hypothetical protein